MWVSTFNFYLLGQPKVFKSIDYSWLTSWFDPMKFGTNWTCWTSSRSTGQTFERSFRYSENKSDFQNYANKSRFSNEFPESFTKQNQKYFFFVGFLWNLWQCSCLGPHQGSFQRSSKPNWSRLMIIKRSLKLRCHRELSESGLWMSINEGLSKSCQNIKRNSSVLAAAALLSLLKLATEKFIFLLFWISDDNGTCQ